MSRAQPLFKHVQAISEESTQLIIAVHWVNKTHLFGIILQDGTCHAFFLLGPRPTARENVNYNLDIPRGVKWRRT